MPVSPPVTAITVEEVDRWSASGQLVCLARRLASGVGGYRRSGVQPWRRTQGADTEMDRIESMVDDSFIVVGHRP